MPRQTQPPPQAIRRRSRGFEAASKLVAGHLRGPMAKRGFAEAKLLTRWAEIVGPEVATIAEPVSLNHGSGQSLGGTLVLLTTGAQAPILEMRKDEVLAKVNACYGYRAVSRIRITQTAATGFAEGQAAFTVKPKPTQEAEPDPAEMAAAEAAIAQVGDERLRAALARLARRALTKT